MSLRHLLTRLFTATIRRAAPLTEPDCARAEIERRERIRRTAPVRHACDANRLSDRDTSRVLAHFEAVAETTGSVAEARTAARNLAAHLASEARRRRFGSERAEPWGAQA